MPALTVIKILNFNCSREFAFLFQQYFLLPLLHCPACPRPAQSCQKCELNNLNVQTEMFEIVINAALIKWSQWAFDCVGGSGLTSASGVGALERVGGRVFGSTHT